nr:glutamate synthase-related protein [Angustibacter aerolatus]
MFRLQHATRARRFDVFQQYTSRVDEQSERLMTLRGLLRLRADEQRAIPLEEVEPIESIMRRFSTGAMSLRLDQPGGARDARRRDEPDRRPVEHRRGRRGRRPAARPGAAQRHQAGGVRPVRRHQPVPHPRRRPADQDGAGCQAG